MKQVAHIRQISLALRRRFGDRRRVGDHVVHTFPPARRIARAAEDDWRDCALGYRAKNLLANARLVSSGEANMDAWSALADTHLREKLCSLDRKSTRLNSSHTEIYTLSLHDALPISKNLLATARLVSSGEANMDAWSALADTHLREKLCSLPGVGPKIANCVMLFAYERVRAFPIDVWIERVLKEQYFPRKKKVTELQLREFSEIYFGEHGGYAQQYLFHHARMALRKSGVSRDSSTSLRSARNDKGRAARMASRTSEA